MAVPTTPMQPTTRTLTRREGNAIYAVGVECQYTRPTVRKISDADWDAGILLVLERKYQVAGAPVSNPEITSTEEQPDGSTILIISHDRVLVGHRARGSRGEGHKRRRRRVTQDRECRPAAAGQLSPQPTT